MSSRGLVEHGDREVDQVMLDLRQAGLARTVHAAGARVPKHKHVLDEAWGLDARQLSVLAVMALRGPNTLRELVTRTERYVDIGGEDGARAVVGALEEGEPAMGTATATDHSASGGAPRPSGGGRSSALEARVDALEAEVVRLRDHVARLEAELGVEESDGG